MTSRWIQLMCIVVCLIALDVSCGKSPQTTAKERLEPGTQQISNLQEPPSIARIYWAGKDAITQDTNAATLTQVWQLPESLALEAQTLDKLSLAPWWTTRPLRTWAMITNYSELVASNVHARLLRPLLQDILEQECHLEVAPETNSGVVVSLAIRLNAEQATRWQTNLAQIQPALSTKGLQLASGRTGEWTRVAIWWGEPGTNQSTPRILQLLPTDRRTNWLTMEINGALLPLISSKAFNSNWPAISMTLAGDGENVRMQGELKFANGLEINLDRWLPPTNIMQHPLVGLTAVRGITPVLQKMEAFSDLPAPALPNQLFVWNRLGPPVQLFWALPTTNAHALLDRIAPTVMATINSNTPVQYYGLVQRTNDILLWTYFQYASPHLIVATNLGVEYLQGGLGLHLRDTNKMPPELLEKILGPTNLIYFDWEISAERIPQYRYVDDITRMSLDSAHRSRLLQHSTSMKWLAAVLTNHLAVASTEAQFEPPNRITFTRKSQVGLTGLEIDLLLNWLEAPDFPYGFTRFFEIDRTPPPPRPTKKKRKNQDRSRRRRRSIALSCL